METMKKGLPVFVFLLIATVVDTKFKPKNHPNLIANSDQQQDTIFLSLQRDDNERSEKFSCRSLSLEGYTQISIPQQTIPQDVTCKCLLKDTLLVAVSNQNISKNVYCDSNSCSEHDPSMESTNVQVTITSEYLEILEESGDVFKYVHPMDKVITIYFYFNNEDLKCDIEQNMPTLPPTQPSQVPPQGTDATTGNDHSHSYIVIALVGSVLINILIIVVAVLFYHKLNARNMKRKMPYMVTAAIQRNNVENMRNNVRSSSRTPPTSPGTGYTPLGKMNPVVLPSGMEISTNNNSDAPTDDETYGATYTPCNAMNLASYKHKKNNNRLLNYSAVSMSDVSSIAPSTDSSNLASSTTMMLSSSMGNVHSTVQPSSFSASNLDAQVPPAGWSASTVVNAKQLTQLPDVPRQTAAATVIQRDISRTSNGYDYIEYDAMSGDREPSHKYLQIT